jgi:hypothetical protein
LSVWLVLRLFSMKRTGDDLRAVVCRQATSNGGPAGADPHRREGRSCQGLGPAGAPEGGGETRQATWAKGRRGIVSSGSAHPRSNPPAA